MFYHPNTCTQTHTHTRTLYWTDNCYNNGTSVFDVYVCVYCTPSIFLSVYFLPILMYSTVVFDLWPAVTNYCSHVAVRVLCLQLAWAHHLIGSLFSQQQHTHLLPHTHSLSLSLFTFPSFLVLLLSISVSPPLLSFMMHSSAVCSASYNNLPDYNASLCIPARSVRSPYPFITKTPALDPSPRSTLWGSSKAAHLPCTGLQGTL